MAPDSPLRSYLLLAAGMAIFGSGTPVSKIVTDAFPVFAASGARMVLAMLALAPLLVWQSHGRGAGALLPTLSRADWARLAGIAVGGMFLFSVFMLYGMKEISGAIGGIVMATTPAVTAAGAILFLGDRLDRWTAIAIGAAVAGVLAVNVGGTELNASGSVALGSALIFGAVCGEATYTLLGKRMTADLTPIQVGFGASVLAALLFAAPAATEIGEIDLDRIGTTDWLALLWWGVGTMALGTVIWWRGVSRVKGTTASAFMGVMPVSAVLLSYLLLGESFEPLHAVGMAAVLGGIAAITRSERETGE